MTTKKCSTCEEHKPLDQFYTQKGVRDGLRRNCKECHKKKVNARYHANPEAELDRQKAYRKANPEKMLERHLRYAYDMSLDTYYDMHTAQEHKCACCGRHEKLVVDHDHDTEVVRSLLCHPCNTAIGLLGDSSTRAAQASAYLSRHGK